jgi:hypothetical protein
VTERTPDLSDVMAAAEAYVTAYSELDPDDPQLHARALGLTRTVNAVRAASGQPPIGGPAYQPCPGPGPEGE